MTIDWNQVPPKREQWLLAAVLFGVVISFFQVIYAGKTDRLKSLQIQAGALLVERDALLKFMKITPTVTRKEAPSGSGNIKLKLLSGAIESSYKDITLLLPFVTSPSFLGKVRLDSFSYQPYLQESGYERTDFILEISGSFNDVVRYLERLEEFPALFQLRDLILSRKEGQGGLLQGEITGRFFKRGVE